MRKGLVLAVIALILGATGCFVAVTPAGVAVGVEPVLTYIPGTEIQVVSNAPDDVFFYGGFYWRFYNGVWYRSRYWNHGWVIWHDVPHVFLQIPPTHPKYHVVMHHPAYKVHSGPPVVKPATAPPVVKPGAAPVLKGGGGPPVLKKHEDEKKGGK